MFYDFWRFKGNACLLKYLYLQHIKQRERKVIISHNTWDFCDIPEITFCMISSTSPALTASGFIMAKVTCLGSSTANKYNKHVTKWV